MTGSPDADARGAELDVAATFAGRSILLIGTTGFVGKVVLSMLLHRYPGIGRVFALVRPGMGNSAAERFFTKVAPSPAFDPLREAWGDGFDAFMREKVIPIPGDIGRPLCNFGPEQFAQFEECGGLACIVNSAALVTFVPSLESAIRINAIGARNVLETARRSRTALLHVSTCYVFGRRDGDAREDEPVVGYFPRQGELRDDDFSAEAEIADCQRIMQQVREMANDRAHISEFREQAARALEEQRRDPDDLKTLGLAVARERKLWVAKQLTALGMERAEHWGWTNTYTYTKSLGEQIILADKEVASTIVRPAVVESALRYPFPGWNEGFNTTAPLLYLMLKGHRQVPARLHTKLDLVPVDLVAAGMIAASAALVRGEHEPVYQLATSGDNPVSARRLTELGGLAARQHRRSLAEQGEKRLENRIRARLETFTVSYERFQQTSAPRVQRLADRLRSEIDHRLPRWGAPRLTAWAARAKDELEKVSTFTGQVTDLVEMFKPFNYDHDITFRCDNIRKLHRRLTPRDQEALPWDPEAIDWRHFVMNIHFPGLVKWVFPILDDELAEKSRFVYTYRDLIELIDAATKLHRHRVALRFLATKDQDADPLVYTYERVQDMGQQGAATLRERGIEPGDRVMLMSENRPEWGISYFAILRAGATVVPVDAQLSCGELVNLVRASGAKMLLVSITVAERLAGDDCAGEMALAALHQRLVQSETAIDVAGFAEILAEPAVSPAALSPRREAEAVASLIYTSGTTGDPKGVMLTHKNLTAMVSKLSSVFKLYRHDSLLSVLPLHHTFEFSAGFLMPLVHGASITYLDEIDADSLSVALEKGAITGMVGVPALWQAFHRKIYRNVADKGIIIQRLFDALVEVNRSLRERVPFGWNLGKVLFFTVHRKLGGRTRLLISGGSALSPDIMKSFRGLGFRLVEGYGMTEASPVLTVTRPNENPVIGSVGRPLPGIDIKIDQPDERGVGEILAKGPNVMKGYYRNETATAQVLRDGWLHTGDLGRLDAKGNLFIVGRKKDMILGPSGENAYPDELEEIYQAAPEIKEISIVGLPGADSAETVAALIVPEYDRPGMSREEVREAVRKHIREVAQNLPQHKRIKVFHLWDHDLPKTATRKVKRREIVAELERLERVARAAGQHNIAAQSSRAQATDAWVLDVIAQVTQKARKAVTSDVRLDELGFDSLMFTELGVALEAAGVALPDAGELSGLATVADLQSYVSRHGVKSRKGKNTAARANDIDLDDEIHVPEPIARAGRRGLRFAQRQLYRRFLETHVCGAAYVPPDGGYIVAANHASHLDMGLVKYALGEPGDKLVVLAAKDYFFDDPIRRAYFENFTNLIPMERQGSLRESLRLAGEVIREGYILLIFPEGTRSTTGVMTGFKPSLGYLARHNRCGILPCYLAGTYDAMPKGSSLPKRRRVSAHLAPFVTCEKIASLCDNRPRSEGYRRVSGHVEEIVRSLAPREYEWTLGATGRKAAAAWDGEGEAVDRAEGAR